MRWETPFYGYWLWAVCALVIVLWRGRVRRRRRAEGFAERPLVKEVALGVSEHRRFWRDVLLAGVFVFGIVALMRPQWGFSWQRVKRQAIDILVGLDTSKSMLTRDVKPNRLLRTKLAVRDLLKKLKGDRIGLMVFAGDAFLVCPLTVDYSGFALTLNDVDTSSVPKGGTNIARAIEVGLKKLAGTDKKHKVMILVTDGDNLQGDPLVLAAKAKEQGVKIYTIGIGTAEGELIQVGGGDGQGPPEFLKDAEGNFVKSRLNERLLQQIALTTGGVYVRASGAEFGLDLIYERELASMQRREIESKMEKKYYERFQIPLAVALMLLAAETWLGREEEG